MFDFAGSKINIAGTAVLRMASNPIDFTSPAEKITGSKINIISGEEEALFTGKGALYELEVGDYPVVLDIGGQSTEISTVDKNGAWRAVSMPLGVVGLKEQFLHSPCPVSSEIQSASLHVNQILDKFLNFNTGKELICVGGTPTTLAMLHNNMNSWSRGLVHGEILNIGTVQKWLGIMSQITPEARIEKFGLRPMRADVFPAGLIVLFEIMKYIDTKFVKVSANGLRVGLALSILG
jgi:exopolyphosphatase/guanosine-5'-triphosphate,3'-diphosphate pyrophosphatase